MFRPSRLLARIRAGKVARVCSTGSPLIYLPQMAAQFGYDAVWVDAEHRAWDAREIRETILRHHLAGIDCVFRPSAVEKADLSRILEDGATALMIPQVNTAERAHTLVAAAKFPPLGDRGLDGSGLDAGFLVGRSPTYTQEANRETALILQIETPDAVENAAAIAAVEGVDLLFMGPGDLSLRLGCAPSLQEPMIRAALDKMIAACRQAGKPWGYPAGTLDDARTLVELGAQFLVFGSEFWGIHHHLEWCARELKGLLRDA
jgi:2-keto-3-deoxy-L-rhamnonate aldolase RhmA